METTVLFRSFTFKLRKVPRFATRLKIVSSLQGIVQEDGHDEFIGRNHLFLTRSVSNDAEAMTIVMRADAKKLYVTIYATDATRLAEMEGIISARLEKKAKRCESRG